MRLVCSKTRDEVMRLEGSERRKEEGTFREERCGCRVTSAILTWASLPNEQLEGC